jgi:hypothetical protein
MKATEIIDNKVLPDSPRDDSLDMHTISDCHIYCDGVAKWLI